MPSGSPVGTTRTFGAQSVVGIGTVSRPYLAMTNRPWQNHHICFRQPGPGLPNLQASVSSSGPTLQWTSTLAEVSEPLAHLQVEIGPCRTAGFQLWKCPRRVRHHLTSRALARLLLWWPLQMHGCSALGRMIRVGLLQGLR